jgi:lysine 2,3-aminomutase
MRHVDVRTTEQLTALTGRAVPAEARPALQRVLDALPVRLTPHLVELIRTSEAVAAQYLPDPREFAPAAPSGQRVPFAGLLSTGCGAVERIYRDRCVLLPVSACPAYCRFCFRKFHRHRARSGPRGFDALNRALSYVAAHPQIREVLITGGEPALDPERLEHLLAGLRQIEAVGPIRVACRALVASPDLINARLAGLMAAHQDRGAGRVVELAAHINHPDELTPATDAALARLHSAGVHVYSQTVLLAGVNDDAGVLAELLRALRRRGVEIYTLYYPEPLFGSDHQRPSLARALGLKRALRAMISGRANPRLIITTRIGKLELGEAEEVQREADGRHVWLRTPYTVEAFRELEPAFELPPGCRVDADTGRIEARYLDGAA